MGSGDITKEHDKLDRILAELAEHRGILIGLANKVASIETRVASIETEVVSINTRLTSLEERVEKKLLETKPLWVAELNGRIDELSGRIDAQRDEMEKGFQLLGGRMDALAIHLNENEGRQRVLDRRLGQLERAS